MPYLIRDGREETDPDYVGWLSSPVPTAFSWTKRMDLAKRFKDIGEAARILRALQQQRRPAVIVDVPG
jgi:hypothetical protein